MTDILFECTHCDGPVVLRTGPGRRREFRQGIAFEIPEDFPIATCTDCGEMYLTTAEAEHLEAFFISQLNGDAVNISQIFREIEDEEDDKAKELIGYKKDCPPSRALVAVQYGKIHILEWIGPDLEWSDDAGSLYDDLKYCLDDGLPPGIYIWDGKMATSYNSWSGEYDAWLEGKWRLATEEEWSGFCQDEYPWDPSDWKLSINTERTQE